MPSTFHANDITDVSTPHVTNQMQNHTPNFDLTPGMDPNNAKDQEEVDRRSSQVSYNRHNDTTDKSNKQRKVRLLGQNLRKSTIISSEFRAIIKYCPLLFIQEPPLVPDSRTRKPYPLGNLHLHYAGPSPRALLAFNKQQVTVLHQFTHPDMASALWYPPMDPNSKKRPIMVISLYAPGDKDMDEILAPLKRAVRYAQARSFPLIIQGDFNAHSDHWGSPETDARGTTTEDFLAEFGLTCHNRGTPTWRDDKDRETHIDLTITNHAGIFYINSWESNWLIHSDHATQLIDLNMDPDRSVVWIKNSIQWGKFQERLDNIIWTPPEEWTPALLDYEVQLLTDELTAAFRGCQRTQVITPHKLKWLTPELIALRQESKRAQARARRTRLPEDKAERSRLRKKYHKALRKRKKEAWKDYVDGMTKESDIVRLTRQFDTQIKLGLVKGPNGEYVEHDKVGEILLNEHCPDSYTPTSNYQPPDKTVCLRDFPQFDFITPKVVQTAIKEFTPGKKPGPDAITPGVLQHLPTHFHKRLALIFRAILALSHVPKIWLASEIIFLPKPGKDDYSQPRAFRPITLQSFVLKTLERVALWKIQEDHFQVKPLHKRQHAFRRNYSCDSALAETIDSLEAAKAQKEFALILFADIKGAFDNLNQAQTLACMRRRGIPEWFITFFTDYLQKRYVTYNAPSGPITRRIAHGGPQGDVISPTFWNIPMDELVEIVNKAPATGSAFADDINVVIRGPSLQMLFEQMQIILRKMEQWANQYGIEFCTKKTTYMIVTNKYKVSEMPKPPLLLYGEPIQEVTFMKYLGVIIDNRLTFTKHIAYATKKAANAMMLAKGRLCPSQLTSPKLLRWLWTCVGKPKFTYGCHLWFHKIDPEKCRSLQRKGSLLIAPTLQNTPSASLEILYDLPPLHLEVKRMAMVKFLNVRHSFERAWRSEAWGTDTSFWNRCTAYLSQLALVHRHQDYLKTICLKQNFTIHLDRSLPVLPPPQGEIHIYTDGSKKDGRVGFGVFVRGDLVGSYHGGLDEGCTVYQAEMKALNAAAAIVAQAKQHGKIIKVFTDSQSALAGLQRIWMNTKSTAQTKYKWNSVGTTNQVALKWARRAPKIKAHAITEGNNAADALAKKGTKDPPAPHPLSKSFFKKILRQDMLTQWNKEWLDATGSYRNTKYWLPTVDTALRGKILRLPRDLAGRCVQFITSFSNLSQHTHRKQDWVPPQCRICKLPGEIESPIHMVTACPPLYTLSWECFPTFHTDGSWTFDQLLRFLQAPIVAQHLKIRVVAPPPAPPSQPGRGILDDPEAIFDVPEEDDPLAPSRRRIVGRGGISQINN